MRVFWGPHNAVWGVLIGVWGIVSGVPAAHAGGGEETFAAPTRALPGLARIGVAGLHAPGMAFSAASGYGYTEDVLDQDDAHHRTRASLALSYRPTSWLGIAAGFDARYDRHVGDGIDASGYVGEPRITARAVRLAPGDLSLAADATLWLPGDRAPSVVIAAASLEARGLASYAPPTWGRHALHLNGGFRLDSSAASAPNADRLDLAQRLALGVSDSDALLLGVGWSARFAPATVFAEWSWDLHVGAGAPGPRSSPMRLGAGVHQHVGDRYQLFGLAELALSARPGLDRTDPLVPVEPRASVLAGLSYQFGQRGAGGAPVPSAAPAYVPPAPRELPDGQLKGRVVSFDGAPIAATVRIEPSGLELVADGDGSFDVELPPGEYEVSITAPGHRDQVREVNVERQGVTVLNIDLRKER